MHNVICKYPGTTTRTNKLKAHTLKFSNQAKANGKTHKLVS